MARWRGLIRKCERIDAKCLTIFEKEREMIKDVIIFHIVIKIFMFLVILYLEKVMYS